MTRRWRRACGAAAPGHVAVRFRAALARPTTFESYPEIGYNFRITDIQAAIGLCQLDRLDDLLARRRAVAERYIAGARHVIPGSRRRYVPAHVTPNWQSFQVRVRARRPD